MNAAKPLRWGIVGLGWVSCDFVAPAMQKSAGSRIVACLGSSLEKGKAFAARFEVPRVHATLAQMMADPQVDAVYVATPNAMHAEAVLAAAAAGKHVLCEKPFAMTIDDAHKMVDACRNAGVALRVAHQLRLEEAVIHAREIVRSGRLGRVAAISLERASASPPRTTWRKDASQSGVVFDVGVHLIDQIHWITGERFAEVSAFTDPDRRMGVPCDQITILGRLARNGHAVIRATRLVASAENTLIIEGTDATLVTSSLRFAKEHSVQVRDAKGSTEQRFPASPIYDLEVPAFEAAVRGEPCLLPTGEESLHIVETTQAVLASVHERSTMTIAG